jgi:ABC-type sugar transport system permease subunit
MMSLAQLARRYHPVLAAMLLPSLLLIGVFSYYPAVRSLIGGFYQWNGFSPPTYSGVPSSGSISSRRRSARK